MLLTLLNQCAVAMDKITVAFGGSFHHISLIVQFKTLCRYSHIALVLPDGAIIESVGKIGCRYSTLEDFKSRYRWWCIGEIACTNQEHSIAQARKYVDDKTPYDEQLTIWQLFGLYIDDEKALNCSEKIAKICGLYRDDSTKYITPRKLFKNCRNVTESYSDFWLRKPTKLGFN